MIKHVLLSVILFLIFSVCLAMDFKSPGMAERLRAIGSSQKEASEGCLLHPRYHHGGPLRPPFLELRIWPGLISRSCRRLQLCPVCLRKLQFSTGFNVVDRYGKLLRFYQKVGFEDEARWTGKRFKSIDD